jgi:hypothetical protein
VVVVNVVVVGGRVDVVVVGAVVTVDWTEGTVEELVAVDTSSSLVHPVAIAASTTAAETRTCLAIYTRSRSLFDSSAGAFLDDEGGAR